MAKDEEWISGDQFAGRLTAKQLACRELGHVWAPHTVKVLVSGGGRVGGYERTMKCRQCRSERRQLLDSRGGVVKNGYNYVDGYLAANVQRGFGREVFRLEAITRWVDQHPEATSNEQLEGE